MTTDLSVFTPLDRACRSSIHDDAEPVAGVVVGTFDCSSLNGRPAEPGSTYCLRCVVLLVDVGYFTPDDPSITIPTIEEFLARRDRGEIDQNGTPL
jgi:hypothetical protein